MTEIETGSETSALESVPLSEWGMPDKFTDWRPGQAQVVQDLIDCPTQFGGSCVPAGAGKSPAYVVASKITDSRLCVLTANKALQNQLLVDFSPMGMVDMRGKSNYSCVTRPHLNCEEAWGGCSAREFGDCPSREAYKIACKAPMIVTNYSFWLNRNKMATGTFTKAEPEDDPLPVDMLVCDEAHTAMNELASFIAVELTTEDMLHYIRCRVPDHTLPMAEWKKFAAEYLQPIRSRVRDMESALKAGVKMDDRELKEFNRLTRISAKLQTLATCQPDMWTVEPDTHGFKFDPVWPGFYAKSLFQDIKRVVLMSATIRPKTLQLLGLKSSDYTFNEYGSPFNPNDAPIIHIPTAKIWHGSTADDLRLMYNRIDQIADNLTDRKGIVHSVSYKRALEIIQNSRHRRHMMTNSRGGRTTADVIAEFLESRPPSILVSPSVVAGHDFAGTACEFNIIPKLSVPDTRSTVMKERLKRDPEYSDYLTIQDLVQACGRGNRFIGDRCQTFITDDSIRRYLRRCRHQFPKYFFDFFRTIGTVPRPLVKMPTPVSDSVRPSPTDRLVNKLNPGMNEKSSSRLTLSRQKSRF